MGKQTISIGGATYDLFVQTHADSVHAMNNKKVFDLPLGEKIHVKNVLETCGGGASNSSVGLSRLGCSAKFCGVIGNDQWGDRLIENFKTENVDTECMTVVDGEVSSFSIILSASSGERTILYNPGTNAHLHDANFNKEVAKTVDWVYLNHIQENSCVIQNDIADILINDDHLRFTWNPGGCQIDIGMSEEHNAALLSQTDLLLLNKEEALKFTQESDITAAIKLLVKAGVKNVCITNGSKGTTASDGTNIYSCPIIPDTTIVDTTGAGDAFGTGMTWALVEGYDLPKALRAGTINATSVVGAIGAQEGLLTDIKMNKRLNEIQLDVTVAPL